VGLIPWDSATRRLFLGDSVERVPAGRVVTVRILAQDFCAPQNQLKCQAA